MKSSKTVKRVLSLVMAVLVVASSVLAAPVQKRAAAAASYSAILMPFYREVDFQE